MLAAGVPSDRLRLLHNAIVVERYRRTGQQGVLAELVGRAVAPPVLVSIGRLSPEKGHADLVDALGIVAAAESSCLARPGRRRAGTSNLVERIRALGLQDSVHLTGYLDRPQRILEEADLMVLPSHTEGLPNAALEALAMEVPVLATRVGGTPEVITDGVTGRLVPSKTPVALADAIIDFLANRGPWKSMARRGQQLVETQFDFAARTRRLEAIYAELAGRAR